MDEHNSSKEHILRRVGYYEMTDSASRHERSTENGSQELALPTRESERLAELRASYDAFPCGARAHTQWTDDLLHGIDFSRFRAESPFMWQLGDGNVPVTYLATYYHHRIGSNADLLNRCTEDGNFGVYAVPVHGDLVTRDRVDSVSELGFLRRMCGLSEGARLSILDIGSGYGRLGWRLNQCFPGVRVLCTDAVPESSYLCEWYLHFRGVPPSVRMVPLPDLEAELNKESVDIAIAVNSLTEASNTAVDWWLNLLEAHDVSHLMIVPHSGSDHGRELFTCEADGKRKVPLATLLRSRGFKRRVLCPKYEDPIMQLYGVSPTYFHLFSRRSL